MFLNDQPLQTPFMSRLYDIITDLEKNIRGGEVLLEMISSGKVQMQHKVEKS